VIWDIWMLVSTDNDMQGDFRHFKKDMVKGYQTEHTKFLPNGKLLSVTVLV
jgi:hypothetical protein